MPDVVCERGHRGFWRNTRGSRRPTVCHCGAPILARQKAARYRWQGDEYEARYRCVGRLKSGEQCESNKRTLYRSGGPERLWQSERIETATCMKHWDQDPDERVREAAAQRTQKR